MRQFALIDENGVLSQYVRRKGGPPNDRHIEVPDGCDLVVGRYRYNREFSRWDPVAFENPAIDASDDSEALYAIALGFQAMAAAGVALPNITLEWAHRRAKMLPDPPAKRKPSK